jgi:hypothetical protein
MKILLRSCFKVNPADNDTLFLRNFLALQESELGFDIPEDIALWNFIRSFVRSHNHVPNIDTLRQHFQRGGETEIVDRLETVLSPVAARTKGDFLKRLEDKADDRRRRRWEEILKEAAAITTSGIIIKEGKEERHLKGPIDAARYIMDKSHDIVTPTLGTRLSGEVTTDGEDFKAEYERIEADPLAGVGQMSGLQQADVALSGAKRYELWIHAAFTGGLKSTFALNWMYNQAIYYRHDSIIFSLEMPYNQCRRIIYSMHSMHEKFKAIRYKLGLQSNPDLSMGLEYQKIRDGILEPAEKEFLFQHVVPDFNNPANEYGKIHIEVGDPEKSDFTVADLRSKCEILFAKSPFATIFVDHVGLMSPRKWSSSTTERLNEVIRDLKRLAMSFNRGMGIAVVALFQINREGYKAAMKRKEKTEQARYDLTHLSYANEAERSADIVTATWTDDDLREVNRVQFQCLKSRDQAPFNIFLARVEWACRRLLTCHDLPPGMEASGGGGGSQSPENQLEIDALMDSLE